jgi:hypothetical protein
MLAFLFLTPWGLDYRAPTDGGSVGGDLLQYSVLTLSLLSAIILIVRNKSAYAKDRTWRRLMGLWVIYVVYSMVEATVRGVDPSHMVRILLPFGLCMIGMAVGGILATVGENLDMLIVWIGVTACVSTVFNAAYALVGMGLTLETVRYSVLGPIIVFLIAISVCVLVYRPRNARMATIGLIIGGVAVILSQTRTEIVVLAVIAGSVFWYVRRHRHIGPPVKSGLQPRKANLALKLIAASALLVVSGVIAIVVDPNILTGFASRISLIGDTEGDPTALTRIAEAAGEVEAMRSSPVSMIFGVGLGSDHYWDTSYVEGVRADAKESGLTEAIWYPGHIGWLYQFYASGLLFGWVLPLTFLLTIRNGWRSRSPLFGAAVVSAFCAYMFQGFLAHPMGYRSGGVVCGLLIGAAAYGSGTAVRKRQKRTPKRQQFRFPTSVRPGSR